MFPNVVGAFSRLSGITQSFRTVSTSIVDYEAEETFSEKTPFVGILEPLHPQKLLIKPEGQRNWKWWTLWTTQHLNLDEMIIDLNNRTYRVMELSDWFGSGYGEYTLVEGIPNANP